MGGHTEPPQPESYMTPGAQANARGAHDAHEWFYCQVCEVDVKPSAVEMHLRGKSHERSKERKQHEAVLFTLLDRGELPSWYEPRRGGLPYCKLCKKEATDNHLISQGHVKAENWERCASATTIHTTPKPKRTAERFHTCIEREEPINASKRSRSRSQCKHRPAKGMSRNRHQKTCGFPHVMVVSEKRSEKESIPTKATSSQNTQNMRNNLFFGCTLQILQDSVQAYQFLHILF